MHAVLRFLFWYSFAGGGMLPNPQCTQDVVPSLNRMQARSLPPGATHTGCGSDQHGRAAQRSPGTLHQTGFTTGSGVAVQCSRRPQQPPQVKHYMSTPTSSSTPLLVSS